MGTEKKEREKKDLIAKIEDLEMTIKSLAEAIEKLRGEIAEMQVQMKRAGEDREKENKEFQATVADQRETQRLLKAALNVLQDFYGKKAAFMQQHKQEPAGPPPPPGFEAYKKNAASGGVMKMIQEIINDAKAMEAEAIRSEEDAQKAYEDFVKETNASIEAKSKEIVNKSELKAKAEGELVETKEAKEAVMLELEQLSNYNAELHQSCDFVLKNFDVRQTARDEEIEALKQAKAILSGAKFEEFLQEQIDKKTAELADTDEKNAQAKEDIEDTKKSLSADEEFLMMLKEKCSMTDKEWEERQKTRQLEMEAVSKALAVLSGDDAHDLFTRTFNPALLQVDRQDSRRARASQLLSSVAKRLNNPKLSNLAYRVRLDAFTRVKKAIDDMVAQLLKEKADEIKHKDFCTDEFNTNQLQTEKKKREKKDLIAKIEDLEMTIKSLAEAIEKLKGEIAEMQVQMKRAGEDREKENKEFQTTVADQRETQKLLKAALNVLQDFYGKKAAFMQQHKQEPAGPPPPPGFEAYKKNAASGGFMKM